MVLNSKTKHNIKAGSVLKDYSNTYTVTSLYTAGNAIYLTTRTLDGFNIYSRPISFYYGTNIIK